MRPFRPLAGAVLLMLLAGACAKQQDPGIAAPDEPQSPQATFPVTLTDDDGVEATIPAEPERVVTFAPSMTEIVFALGLGERLVGVSGDYDDYPPDAAEIEHVGGAGDFGVDPNVEKVVELEPDLFLAVSGGDQWKEQLRGLGVPVFTLNATDFEDLLDDIEVVGELTGASEEAKALVAELRAQADSVSASMAGGAPVTCFFEVGFPPLLTVGPNTFLFDLLERSGCEPVSAGADTDYPEWSVEQLVADGPQVYLVTDDTGVTPEDVAARPGFDVVPAVAEGRVEVVDGDLVTRPGPRIVEGLEQLAELMHPAAG